MRGEKPVGMFGVKTGRVSHNVQSNLSVCCQSSIFARQGRGTFYSALMQTQTDRRIFLQTMAAGTMAGPLTAAQRQPWDEIATYFEPPKEWWGKLGKYRSPLIFNDGSKVKAPADWAGRRSEIL